MTEAGYELNSDSGDRFGFGFFVALALHLILIFGIAFEWVDSRELSQDLDVTLVTHFSQEEPKEADFFAQANQEASGTLDEAAVPTSPEPSSRSETIGEEGSQMMSEVERVEADTSNPVLSSTGESEASVENADRLDAPTESQSSTSASSRQALLARFDMLRQDYAKRPKIGTLTSVAAKAREDAEYQIHLQERVIEVGNQNYPQESIDQEIFGSLRIMLTILPDGSLESTEIAESSGQPILDSAAIKIAKLAAPFSPFSQDLNRKYDKVVFIRTWQFLPGGVLTSTE